MNFLRRGRRRGDGASSAASKQRILELEADDEEAIYLPGHGKIYVTQTKNGKPAFGRRRPDKLLEEYGFDILGQSLGIPSRRDLERQARQSQEPRRMSVASQSSGIITAPNSPRQSRGILKHTQDDYSYGQLDDRRVYRVHDDSGDDSPVTVSKASSIRSSSTPAPGARRRRGSRPDYNAYVDGAYDASNPYPTAGYFYPPHPPPHPHAGPWNYPGTMNHYTSPMAPGYGPTAYPPAHCPGCPPQVTPGGGPPGWAPPQPQMNYQYKNPMGFPVPQTTSMPTLPQNQYMHQHLAPYPPVGATAHAPAPPPTVQPTHTAPFQVPPPPPPPPPAPPALAQGHGTASGHVNAAQQEQALAPKQTDKDKHDAVPAADAADRPQTSIEVTNIKSATKEKNKQHISRRIRHVHICAGCGKKRSREYQKAHPLKRGEIPEPDYCYRCIRDAADSSSELSSSDSADDISFIEYAKEAPMSGPSTDEGRATANGSYVREKNPQGPPRWIKKSRRLSLLSDILLNGVGSKSRPKLAKSISSAEESRSRASSPARGPKVDLRSSRRTRQSMYRSVDNSKESVPLPQISTSSLSQTTPAKDTTPAVSKGSSRGKQAAPTTTKRDRGNTTEDTMRSEVRLSKGSSDVTYKKGVAHSSKLDLPNEPPGAPEPVTSNASWASGKASSRVPSNISARLPSVVSSQVSSKNAAKAANASPSKDAVPVEEHQGPFSAYEQPSVHHESSEAMPTNFPDFYNDRPASSYYQQPDFGFLAHEGRRHSTTSTADAQEPFEFIPFPESNQFEAWPQEPLPELDTLNNTPTHAPRWDEPAIPTDSSFGDRDAFYCFMRNDSWAHIKSDIEREAEEMAERDLAAAGKLFGGFDSSWGGSATSSFPVSSLLTRSEISIESCESDEARNDRNVAYEMAEGSDAGETVKDERKSVKQLEFSSDDDLHHRDVSPLVNGSNSMPRAERRSGRSRASNEPARNLYDCDDNDSSVSSEILPPASGSSVLAHTGHSMDDLELAAAGDESSSQTTVGDKSRRIRRFMRL
ncbi:Uu.00g015140.m01.CDS01 [Anthostomella pinea]|uniref:Uu.00g015140.m01.CDS01 n=1 Tax=Anthostomella pinea TaxID=933095 RepID=A0AAI8VZD5_9PEZI|nr:Uu.00g015140.m01.CDS01 [Anthostomella pinea]